MAALAAEGGVVGVVSPRGLPLGFASALTSRETPEEEEMLLEKESYDFLLLSPSSPLLMATIRSSSSSTLGGGAGEGRKRGTNDQVVYYGSLSYL